MGARAKLFPQTVLAVKKSPWYPRMRPKRAMQRPAAYKAPLANYRWMLLDMDFTDPKKGHKIYKSLYYNDLQEVADVWQDLFTAGQ
jgi:hypothetical protein